MFDFLKKLLGGSYVDLSAVIAEGATLVDVRTPAEFASGSVKGAVNIPLNVLPSKVSSLKNKKNIIVFCASGMRSGQAKSILTNAGIANVYNGGSWFNVDKLVR